jgi:hypothetical protein
MPHHPTAQTYKEKAGRVAVYMWHLLKSRGYNPLADSIEGMVDIIAATQPTLAAVMDETGVVAPLETYSHMAWAASGLPQVSIGEKFAASLMATEIPANVADVVALPFQAMAIMVPQKLVYMSEPGTGQPMEVSLVVVSRVRYDVVICASCAVTYGSGYRNYPPGQPFAKCPKCSGPVSPRPPGWFWIAYPTTHDNDYEGLGLWRHHRSFHELSSSDDEVTSRGAFDYTLADLDKRASTLIGRLVGGVCLTMSDPTKVKPPSPGKKHGASIPKLKQVRTPRDVGDLRFATYVVGHPIQLDVRREVSDFAQGRRHKPPKVQTLVAGHWKRQRFGKGRVEIKAIHIEPYFRGPKDAPLKLREFARDDR